MKTQPMGIPLEETSVNQRYFDPSETERLAREFRNGQPYPHIVLDNFLNAEMASLLLENFPSIEKLSKHYKGLNENKSEGSNFSDFHPVFNRVREEIMSPAFAEWVAKVTGIPGVFVTDDNLGTGLHQGSDGSFLDIHVDFNIHHVKNVHRRLNMLLYLNKDWKPEYGGSMEMWNANMTQMIKKVSPDFNRCLIFETSDISYHGYSKIHLPAGVTRKSFYTYFYTPIADKSQLKDYHDTVFKAKPEDTAFKKVGTTVKEKLKNTIKAQLKRMGIKF
jgi:Rps23 Pro-64 3,4-dihydroxylase Tpa1-like proline 4-hydroxylase